MNGGPAGGPVIAVLGFGEAGSLIATGLSEAGLRVRGFDPAVPAPAGVEAAGSDADACRGADLVLSLTTAAAADDALRQSLPGLVAQDSAGQSRRDGPVVYADANTATAGAKARLAEVAEAAGVPFADIAIMAPVPGSGHRVPMLISGPGAQRASALLAGGGATIQVLEGPAGTAATRKLLRSVFYKGMAAAVIEALLAARSAGCEDWLREHIAAELVASDENTVARMETGSYKHALRRSHEMAAAADLLGELGVPARVTEASQLWLEQFARQAGAAPAAPDA
jgi:3-hydroxyisobutyrate dehydrogenase-like beta-hydroxyacid dehydrogenase